MLWSVTPLKAGEKHCPYCQGYGLIPANRERVTVKNNCYKCCNCGGSGKQQQGRSKKVMTNQEFIKLPWNHPYYDDADRISQVMQLMEAGDKGRQAYKADLTRRDNPYPANTDLHKQWDTSFCQALHESIANPIFWVKDESQL